MTIHRYAAGALSPDYDKRQEEMRAAVRRMEYRTRRHPDKCPIARYAWTGGDSAPRGVWENEMYRRLVSFFFREQLRECGGLDLWAGAGTSALERARIFWKRATADAWATFREYSPRPGYRP